MSENSIDKEKQKNLRASLRVVLLVLQILLPFGLYLGLQWNSRPLAILMAVLIGLSMAFLVWLG